MRIAQELINKPIISVDEGREVGKARDFYVDQNMTHLVAIYLGSESLLKRKDHLIKWPDVVTLGEDAILVKDADCVIGVAEAAGFENTQRRDDISGRSINTPGGTKIGRIGDIVLDDRSMIEGFSLSQLFVSGPVATSRVISRRAVIDIGGEDVPMTVDLAEAEKTDLQIIYEGLFAEPSVSPNQPAETPTETHESR